MRNTNFTNLTYGLVCRPSGGLANRLLAILSALRLARAHQCPVKIVWIKGQDCYCDWIDLFSNSDMFITYSVEDWKDWLTWADEVMICDGVVNEHTNAPILEFSRQRKIVACHCGLFSGVLDPPRVGRAFAFDPWVWELCRMIPLLSVNSFVKEKLGLVPQECFRRCLGVHVRRPYSCGHAADLEKRFSAFSPEFHLHLAKQVMNMRGLDRIFLSTNSSEIEAVFQADLGERVWFHPKISVINWEESEAVVGAFLDLLSLASCSEMIGTVGSSFSFLAALIGRIDLYTPSHQREGKLILNRFGPGVKAASSH